MKNIAVVWRHAMSYPLADLDGMNADSAKALKAAKIRTTGRLLEAARSFRLRKQLAASTGLSEKQLLSWANMADRMRIKGIGQDNAKLLEAAGVTTVRELKYRNPAKLAEAMAAANSKRRLVRILPTEKAIRRWIDEAGKLDPKISY
jgi:predicted flap endonuclease-1-like 5' DNA nuclease